MHLLRLDEVPIAAEQQVFRYSPVRALSAGLIGICAAGGFAWLGWLRRAGVAYYLAAVILAAVVVLQTFVRARFLPSNWLVRAGDEGLFVQFRSYLNYRFPAGDATVVFIPYREVRSARLVHERRDIPDRSSPAAQVDRISEHRRRLVEIELAAETGELARALAAEAAWCGPEARQHGITITRYKHYPMRLVSPETLQLEWNVVPRPEQFLALLGRHAAVTPKVDRSEDYSRLEGLSREEQVKRLLELAETGQTMAAIYLARRLYSYDLTEARTFVEDLHRR
jgi:hypothetical protein